MKSVGDGIFVDKKWKFNQEVAKKFEIHIKKSIPFYQIGHSVIITLIGFYIKKFKRKYPIIIVDLGCSTGRLIQQISKTYSDVPILFYGIDFEESMLKIARKKNLSNQHKVNWIHSRIEDFHFSFSIDICISYYSLQFIAVKYREKIINSIYKNLYKNGLFFLFEKTKIKNKIINDYNQFLLESFKLNAGFTKEEIKNKEKSLKNILISLTSEENFSLLKKSGFRKYDKILQYSFFEGIMAIK